MLSYEDVLTKFDDVWCVKGLIVTHNNLVVTWKVIPDGLYFLPPPPSFALSPWGGCTLLSAIEFTFNLCQQIYIYIAQCEIFAPNHLWVNLAKDNNQHVL